MEDLYLYSRTKRAHKIYHFIYVINIGIVFLGSLSLYSALYGKWKPFIWKQEQSYPPEFQTRENVGISIKYKCLLNEPVCVIYTSCSSIPFGSVRYV